MMEERDNIISEYQKKICWLSCTAQSILVDSKNILNNEKKLWLLHLCFLKTGYIEQITLFPLISQALKLEGLALVTSYQLPME